MNKVILKAALFSIGLVAIAALTVFSLWILISPQSMASACENTGNYSFAVTCADLRYKYTGNAYDLARCAEDGILSGKDGHILTYCPKLIADEAYEEVCAAKDYELSQTSRPDYTFEVKYNGYIRGHLAAARYRAGEKDEALQTAAGGGAESFAKLVIEIVENKDKETAQKAIQALEAYGSDYAENLTVILKNIG